MKRIIIFAHFDKQNIIDPYVIDYIRELKKYSEIIFVSDGDLQKKETEKIKDLCFDIIAKKHGESNDFGSYKRGFQLLQNKYPQKLQEIDELLFVNDSCYLIGNFKKIFADMEKKLDCDFWGLSDDIAQLDYPEYHIQSYFLVFRKEVFLESFFQNFISNIKQLRSKNDIIYLYEIGITQFLINNNYKHFCYFSRKKIIDFIKLNKSLLKICLEKIFYQNTTLAKDVIRKFTKSAFSINCLNYSHSNKFYFLLEMNFPLIKRNILIENNIPNEKLVFLWQEILEKEKKSEAIKKIKNHCNRIGLKLKNKNHIKNRFNLFLYFLSCLKLFYIKKYLKNGKKVKTIKLLFFKIKLSDYKRLKLFGIRVWKK